jgi:hypothetical protein
MLGVFRMTYGRLDWRTGATVAVCWWLLAPCLTGAAPAVQDRREEIAQESQRYRAQHFPDGRMPPKHGWRQSPRLQPASKNLRETPGGVGYGYYFDTGALLWTNCSIADYYVIAPSSLHETISFLYLTSTCRAQLGTESLIAYQDNEEAQFWIFDWSLSASDPWQTTIDLATSHPEYLTVRPDEFAVNRQMVHLRNGTYYLGKTNGLYNWQNQTLLFDFVTAGWDLVYSHDYTTTNLTDNIPLAGGESVGFWGPIVETFQTYTNIGPVGFDFIRLFQDGKADPFWLSPANSYSFEATYNDVNSTTNWSLLTEAKNTSYTVTVGANSQPGGPYNMGSLCVTANTNTASFTLSPSAGLVSPYWIIKPNSNSWDKIVVGLPPGAYTIIFNPASGFIPPVQQSFSIATNTVTDILAVYGTKIMAPVLQSASLLGQTLTCNWSGQSNVTYQAQDTADLAQTNWSNLGSPIAATNATVTTSVSVTNNPQCFYRLLVLP